MTMTRIEIRFPYTETFVFRRKQQEHQRSAWANGLVEIEDIDEKETSIVYRIERLESKLAYQIRSHDGKLLWPVFETNQALSVDDFQATVGDQNGYFLTTMRLSDRTFHDAGDVTAEQLDRYLERRLIRLRSSNKAERWQRTQLSASRLRFCGGFVYRVGGPPAYFGVPSRDRETLSLVVGSLGGGRDQLEDHWHLGPTASQRRNAALRTDVFNIYDVDDTFLASKRRDCQLVLTDRVETIAAVPPEIEATDHCGSVMAHAVLRPQRWASCDHMAFAEDLEERIAADSAIERKLACEIIAKGLAMSATTHRHFGIQRERAREVLATLRDRSFTEEQDQAISSFISMIESPTESYPGRNLASPIAAAAVSLRPVTAPRRSRNRRHHGGGGPPLSSSND